LAKHLASNFCDVVFSFFQTYLEQDLHSFCDATLYFPEKGSFILDFFDRPAAFSTGRPEITIEQFFCQGSFFEKKITLPGREGV
jgi:hypothetical protein